MILSDLDMMVESILMVMEEHSCKLSDGRRLTADEVMTMSETEILDLFKQIYGRD